MPTFFRHANQPSPPSISDNDKLRLSKIDLLNLLPENEQPEPPSAFDASVIDSAALVHLLPTTNAAIFDEYADLVLYLILSDSWKMLMA